MTPIKTRLEKFLSSRGYSSNYSSLTADASTREYFRIDRNGGTAVACVYPEPFDPAEHTYIDVTELFLSADLPVAEIYDVDGELGVIVLEDLGDRVLREVLNEETDEVDSRLLREAISLIARIQTATDKAYEMNSVASRLKFDAEKLLWELNFFKEHYFGTYLNRPLSANDDAALSTEFAELADELGSYASVLCHRDFHAANLMLDGQNKMRIIDHQDARIGSPAYDLVSLLLDRITELPSPEFLAIKRRYFLDVRRTLGLPKIDEGEFAYEFRLQTLQRCLKAAGTFSYQSAVRQKTYFVQYIQQMFRIVFRSGSNLDRFPNLLRIVEKEIAQYSSN
ncbi:MAG: phosphotransferase [Acidobacteria bacterium]|nr:phosphotransferase [Acidobacteriota bacterium]